jgi:DNA topoisomerase-1
MPDVRPHPKSIARSAGLHYSIEIARGIRRVRRGKSFRYVSASGKPMKADAALKRIRLLAIPPAYEDVLIASDPKAHIQAVGRDARGRKQYRYHPKWAAATAESKFHRVIAFARALPRIRRSIQTELRAPGMTKRKVTAAVVRLLDKTLIRVGNEEYARKNKSFGLSTLRNRHVDVRAGHLVFHFKGKSGVYHEIDLHDPKLARIVGKCRDLPGQSLFQFLDGDGMPHALRSQDVNAFLHEIAGEMFTAKDFRTWAGTVLASIALREIGPAKSETEAKRKVNAAITKVAEKLGNTKAVCRKSYIHPRTLEAYNEGKTIAGAGNFAVLPADERRVLAFLQIR